MRAKWSEDAGADPIVPSKAADIGTGFFVELQDGRLDIGSVAMVEDHAGGVHVEAVVLRREHAEVGGDGVLAGLCLQRQRGMGECSGGS